ncbi:ABC transporter periplasmic-binding protein YtfQ precursor [compost metagenome]
MLYAHNDDMAIGAIQAIEEAGLKPGKDIIIVSIDGVKGAFQAMIAGKPVAPRIVTEERVFPAEVAAKELPNRKY